MLICFYQQAHGVCVIFAKGCNVHYISERGKQSMKQDEFRQQLIDGTVRVIARDGLDKASAKQIELETGINAVYIYRCFKDKEEGKEKKECKYLRKEFSYSRFTQTLLLPDNADKDAIEARVENGILYVNVPKLQKSARKSLTGHAQPPTPLSSV